MATTSWSREEDRILAANYPSHGSSWVGWESLLPDRTGSSIRNRAQKIGVSRDDYVLPRVTMSESIIRMFHEGSTCSRIDELLGLHDGKAHDVVVKAWYEEKQRGRGFGTR